jgi:hypothetical protein
MKKNIIAIVVVAGVIAGSCSKNETTNNGLRGSLEDGVAAISSAVSDITGTTGYKMLSLTDVSTKSEDAFNDSINLSLVDGIYDFSPDTVIRIHHFSPYRLFKKTGESGNMVVNMPELFVFHPKHLHFYQPLDTVLTNNFTITATDYHLFYNWWNSYDYKLTAGFTLDTKSAGSMDVSATSTSYHNQAYSSKFNFNDGYSISEVWQNGDTAKSAFALTKNNDTLFKEKVVFIWHEFHKSERQYTLTIGDVEIKRGTNLDSIQVFLGGVLQKEAGAVITDDSDTTGSICQRRDILLTFDDGTTSKLSDLIDPVREQLKTLRESLHNMWFAKNIVDYIAFSIYYNTH